MLRDNLVGLIEPMRISAGVDPLALSIQTQASDDRSSCLENPRPEGAESSLTENVTSPFQAEPVHSKGDSMSKRKRVLIWLGALAAAVALYVWFFGVATMFALEARYTGWKMPVVKKAPIELSDLSVSKEPGQKFTYSGYEFELPWPVDESKTRRVSPTSVVFVFRTGNALWFSKVPPKEFVNEFLSMSRNDAGGLRQLYGDEALRSDYSLINLVLGTTPRKIGLLSDRRQAAGGTMLLVIKGIMIPNGGETGIFRVRAGGFQGFQYGNPGSRPRSIDVEIFADDGGLAFLFAQNEKGSVPAITQAEINMVLQSVRKASN